MTRILDLSQLGRCPSVSLMSKSTEIGPLPHYKAAITVIHRLYRLRSTAFSHAIPRDAEAQNSGSYAVAAIHPLSEEEQLDRIVMP